MPFFSIIIPTYNSSATLKTSLESVLMQTLKDFEIIIMDGLSTDNSLAIAMEFQDSRIKIYSESDTGVYDAMNKAIGKANGEWLYFLGSDDELYDKNVLKTINEISINQNYNLIYGNAFYTGRKKIHGGLFDRKRFKTNNICHQATFYKRHLFEQLGGYNTQFKIWADWDFNIRCFSYPNINTLYINQVIVNYDDLGGLSALQMIDNEFIKLLPSYIEEDVIILKMPFLKTIRKLIPNNIRRSIKSFFEKPLF